MRSRDQPDQPERLIGKRISAVARVNDGQHLLLTFDDGTFAVVRGSAWIDDTYVSLDYDHDEDD